MELLVILLGEFLLIPVIAAFGALGNLLLSIVSFIFELLFNIVIFAPTKKQKKPELKTGHKRNFTLFKWVAGISGSLCLVVFSLLFVVNSFLFAPTINWIASQAGQKAGVTVSFDTVEGSIFSGKINFQGLKAYRQNSPKNDFDLSVKEAELDINVFSLISKPIVIEKLLIDGVDGKTWQKTFESADEKQPQSETKGRKIKTKTEFIISELSLTDIDLLLHQADKRPLQLSLEQIKSSPFRSRYAVFDTFFRSDISGSLNGHGIEITSKEEGQGRKTKWHLDNFPVNIVNQYVQKAPISWFKTGIIDIRVEDEWELSDNAEINMDWNLQLKNVVVEPPANASIISQKLSSPIVNYINNKGDIVDLQFSLMMNESQFESASSLDAAGMWDAVVDSLSKNIALSLGEKKEVIKDTVQEGFEGFKNYLNKKRQ